MKHPYLCACLTFAMCVTAYHSGVRLNAAELWNSKGAGSSSSSSSSYYIKKDRNSGADSPNKLFNGTRKFNPANGTELFNSQDRSKVSSGEGGLEVAISNYKNITLSKQKPSKQFKTMSASAVANRQADIDHALQLEYNRRKETAKNGIEVARKDQAARIKGENEHLAMRAEMRAAKEAAAMERENRKARALGLAGSYTSSRNRSGKYTSRKSSATQLKKPARLFNDPNE